MIHDSGSIFDAESIGGVHFDVRCLVLELFQYQTLNLGVSWLTPSMPSSRVTSPLATSMCIIGLPIGFLIRMISRINHIFPCIIGSIPMQFLTIPLLWFVSSKLFDGTQTRGHHRVQRPWISPMIPFQSNFHRWVPYKTQRSFDCFNSLAWRPIVWITYAMPVVIWSDAYSSILLSHANFLLNDILLSI